MNNEILIREMTLEDMAEVHALVRELAEYEKGLHNVTTSAETYRQDFNQDVFRGFVAQQGQEIIGIAIYYFAFSTWRGKMVYLEDFVVRESQRRSGIGEKLFNAFLDKAKEEKASLVKWQVLKWNEPAISFYKKYETVFDDEWLDGKIYFQKELPAQ
jgi:GNAT superfamily N-acetyltransferase